MTQQVFKNPKGYVLVPAKPTPEMIAAGEGVEDLYRRGTPDTWAKVYRAMLVASPAIPINQEFDAELWAELYTLREAVKGPKGFSTWQDAAIHERQLRVKAEETKPTIAAL